MIHLREVKEHQISQRPMKWKIIKLKNKDFLEGITRWKKNLQ